MFTSLSIHSDRSNKRNDKGFTLTEILVATGIMVILLTVAMINYRTHQRKSSLNAEAQRLISLLKQAQMRALTGKEVEGVRPTGYGVYFFPDNISYFFFADRNEDYLYNFGEEIEKFSLPTNLTIDYDKNNIIFIPPEAEVYFDGKIGSGEALITFQHAGIAETKEVRVVAETGKVE